MAGLLIEYFPQPTFRKSCAGRTSLPLQAGGETPICLLIKDLRLEWLRTESLLIRIRLYGRTRECIEAAHTNGAVQQQRLKTWLRRRSGSATMPLLSTTSLGQECLDLGTFFGQLVPRRACWWQVRKVPLDLGHPGRATARPHEEEGAVFQRVFLTIHGYFL